MEVGPHSSFADLEFGGRGDGPHSIDNESNEKLVLDEGGSNLKILTTNDHDVFIMDQQGLGTSKHIIAAERTKIERSADRVVDFFEKSRKWGSIMMITWPDP